MGYKIGDHEKDGRLETSRVAHGRPKPGGEHGGLHMAEKSIKHHHSGALHMATAKGGGKPPKGGMPGASKGSAGGRGMRSGTTHATGKMASRFDRMSGKSGSSKY